MRHAIYWILGALAVYYILLKSNPPIKGQEGNTTTQSTGSTPFWTAGGAGGWYTQHFPSGAQ